MSRITRFILTLALISLVGFVDMFAATAPSRQARYISFSNVTSTSVDLTLVKGNGNNRVIVFSTDADIDAPTDGTNYTTADGSLAHAITVGSDVVYDNLTGSEWTSSITGLNAGQKYYVKVFEYNADGSAPVTAFNTADGTTSNPRSFTTLVTVNPPTNLGASVTATTADLEWTAAVPAPDGYILSLLVDSETEGSSTVVGFDGVGTVVQPYDELDISNGLAFDLTDLIGNSDYKYTIYSYIGNTNSSVAELAFYTPVDATPPGVVSIALSGLTGPVGVIYEGDDGNNIILTVTFTEAMKTWMTPTFAFSNTSDLSYVTGSWNPAGTVFTATFLVADTDQEHTDVDITIGNAEDLAGLLISAGTPAATDVFSIDNKPGVLSAFTYSANYCRSGANADVIQFSITLAELGYNSSAITANLNFVVKAEDQVFANPITFTSANTGNGVYTFTSTLPTNQASGIYNLNIQFTDGAGNVVTETHNQLFTIDNAKPVFSDVSFGSACVNSDDFVTLTFTAKDENGCGTFGASNIGIVISGNIGAVFTNTSVVGDVFTYTLDVPADNDGNYNVTITATDAAGNVETNVTNGAFRIDNTAPLFSDITVTNTCLNNGTDKLTFTFKVEEIGCGIFDAGNLTVTTGLTDITPTIGAPTGTGTHIDPYVFTYSYDVNGETNGAYDITVNGIDDAGNAGSTLTSTGAFTIDNTAPLISALSVSPTCNNAGDVVNIEFDITEAGCGSLNNVTVTGLPTGGNGILAGPIISDNAPYHYAYTYTVGTTDVTGNYTVLVDAKDGAGNSAIQAGVSPTNDFAVDNFRPINVGSSISTACVKEGGEYNFSFTVKEIGCGTFDATNVSISGFPIAGNGVLSAPDITYDSGQNTYTFDYTYTIGTTTAQGSYPFTVSVTDDAGNIQANTGPSGTINVDKTAPTISAITLDKSCVKTGDVVAVSYTVTDPTALCDMDEEFVTISGYDLLGTMSTPSISVNAGLYTYSANLTITSAAPTGTLTLTVNAEDMAENAATPVTADISIDNAGPTLSALTVTPPAAGGSTTQVVIGFTAVSNGCSTFDANSVVYTFTGPGTIAGVASLAHPTFNINNDKWETTLQIANTDKTGNYHISIVAADGLGNASNTLDPAGVELVIDNTPPQVATVTASKILLNRADDDGNAGTTDFSITVTYNEAINQSVIPDLTFHLPSKDPTSPAAALVFVSSSSPTTNSFKYNYSANKSTNIDMRAIGVSVNGAKDVAGNTQTSAGTKGSLFGIDFIAPQLASITATPETVVDGTGQLVLVLDFTETMVNSAAPTLVFSTGDNGKDATLGQILGTMTTFPTDSKWNLGNVFTAKYNVNGTYGLEVDDVAVGVTNATDLAGNPFPGSNESEVFSVDTKEPGCAGIVMTPTTPMVILSDLDFEVTVAMDQTLNANVKPTIALTNTIGTYTIDSTTANGYGFKTTTNLNDSFKFKVTHNGTQENTTATLSISGLQDTHGNVQVAACTANFDVDTKLPSITSITATPSSICGNTTGTMDVVITFDEAMKAATAPTIAFAGDIVAGGVLTAGAGSWTVGNTVFTKTYTINATTGKKYTDVDVLVSGAQDALGNTMTANPVIGNDKINVDTEAPSVIGIAFNPIPSNAFGVNRSNIGANGFNVVVTYSEAMASASTPTIAFSAGNAALTIGTGTWTSTTVYTQAYTVNGVALELSGITATVTDAKDVCGNVQTSATPITTFAIDLIAPTCSSISNNNSDIFETDLSVTVSVLFSEVMATSPTPTFSITGSSHFTAGETSWPTTSEFKQVFTHDGTQEVSTTSFEVNNLPTDLAGNTYVTSCSTVVHIDTKKPTVTLVEFTPEKVNGTTELLKVAVTFNETMDNTVNPTLVFNAGNAAFTGHTGEWNNDNTIFTFNYTVVDEDVLAPTVTVTINTAKDVAGNVMAPFTSTNSFAVDQVSPTIVSLSVSDAMINKAEANNVLYRFTATATFSEAMNTTVNVPTIAFAPDVTGATPSLTLDGTPAWSNGDKTVAWTYTVTDQDFQSGDIALEDIIDITIAGGQDLFGNLTDYTAPNTGVYADKFDIDTKNPTVEIDGSTPSGESCVNGTEAISFLPYDYRDYIFESGGHLVGQHSSAGIDDVQARIGAASFATFAPSNLLNTASGWGDASDGPITLDLLVTDLAGNSATISRVFTKDTKVPVVSAATFTNNCVTENGVVGISFTVTDDGCGGITSASISASGFNTTGNHGSLSAFTVTGSSPTFTVTASYTVGISDPEGAYDITFNATDGVGNASLPSLNEDAFTIDKTAPSYSPNTAATPACVKAGTTVSMVINSADVDGCGTYGASNIAVALNYQGTLVFETTDGGVLIGIPNSLESALIDGTITRNGSSDAYTIVINTDDLSDGAQDVTIVMTDAAGNINYQLIDNAFTIDNSAPLLSELEVTSDYCLNDGTDKLVVTFEVVETGCKAFTSSNLTVATGLVDSNPTITNTGTGTSGDPYIFTYKFDISKLNGDIDREYNITVNAADQLGNVSTTLSPAGPEFKVDNTAPVIAITNPTAGANVNASKVVNYTVTETGCGVNMTLVSFNNTDWNEVQQSGNTLGAYLLNSGYVGFDDLNDGPFTLYFKSTDFAGNVGTSSVALVKDTQAPTVTSVTPSDNLLTIADNGTSFTVAVLFNDNMDATVNPTVALTANGTVTNSTTSGTWTTGTQFTATFGNINGASEEEIANLSVTVSGAKDNTEDIGNAMVSQELTNVFSIDTKAPTCSGMTNDNALIYEGGKTVTVTVNFSEVMAATPLPTLSVSGTSNLVPSTGIWANTTTFTQLFTHNGNEETTSANFQVGNTPTDLAGNPVTAQCSTDVVIDTRKPLVSGVTFTPALITRATTTFSVAVAFDETMGATIPTLAFNGGVGSAFTLQGSSGWSGSTYTFNYNVSNSNNYSATGLTVDISGAKDAAGNVMLTKTSTQTYAIDQLAPTISAASIKSNNSINDQYAHVGNDIKLTITPSEKLTTFTGNIAGYSGFAVSDQFIANGTYVLTVSTDPGVSAGLVTFSINYKDLNGNAGATLTAVTNSSSVTVDKVAPVGTIAQAGGQADPTVDSPINFALTFSENVYGLTNGDIAVSGTAGATTAVVTGSGAIYNVAVTGMTGGGTVVITLANAKVTDIAGNDNTTTTNTDNTVTYNVSGATTVAAGAGTEPATLSSLVNTQGAAVLNFDFAVTDDGGTPGADLLATLISSITVSQSTGNDFGNWNDVIAGAELTDGTNTVTGTVGATSIAFTGLAHGAGQIGEVADNATKTYTLKVWLSSTPTGTIDNQNLAFKVNRSSFVADAAGSSFASGAGTDVQSGSTNNAINVIATKLLFTTTPVNTEINTATTFVIIAADANGNKDVDYGPSTVTLTPNLSTISSGGSGSLTSGTLTLSAVKFSTAFANDYVTASNGTLTDGVSSNFNIKEATPAAITNLVVVPNRFAFNISWTNPDGKNTLIVVKQSSSNYAYTDEINMDSQTSWNPNAVFGTNQTPSDNNTFVIFAGNNTNVIMSGLNNKTFYAVTAYAYAGTLNSDTQNFNENETATTKKTQPKEADYSDAINKGLRLGIDNISPQPANLNNIVSLQVETIEDMPLTLELYDSKGQKMMTLFEGKDFTAGETPFEFNLMNTLSSGQHFLRLTGNGHVVIAPLMIVK